ncbi:hypothetical protein ACFLUY_01205 [Chloroflexota bacterium]
MKASQRVRVGETSSHISIILVTLAQLIFFTRFHKYIAWNFTEPDGSITRLSMLTDDYFTWLPIMITGSIIVILSSIVMIIYNEYKFTRTIQIGFNIIGIVISVSLIYIYPFDFSVIPSTTAVDVAPILVTGFFILLAVFYATASVFMFIRIRNYSIRQNRQNSD